MANQEPKEKLSALTADITVAVAAFIIALAFLGVYIQEIIGWYQETLEWFYSRNWQKLNAVLTIIFSAFNLALLIFIIFVLRRYDKLKKGGIIPQAAPVEEPALPKEEVRKSWEYIRELANSSSPSDWNMAVLRSDALIDDVLRELGYEGTTLAERLKVVDPTKLQSLERIWSAHRLRNMIAHDPLVQHTRETIVHALRSYEQALKELGMMEEKEL